ncbi:MAG: DUF2283 domain-containing protein [Actinobacteria bacterium]|nr:DUF2283 domain-containing protein [Actinomycetota bacterium]
MNITVAGITFDHHHYDPRGDVLYLNVGEPRSAAHGLETPEGHSVHYDEDWTAIGLTLLNVRWTLEREGALTLTWPPARLAAEQLDDVLAPA